MAVTVIFLLLFSPDVSAESPGNTIAWIQIEGGPAQSGIPVGDVVGQGTRVDEECEFPKFTVGMKGDVSRVAVISSPETCELVIGYILENPNAGMFDGDGATGSSS